MVSAAVSTMMRPSQSALFSADANPMSACSDDIPDPAGSNDLVHFCFVF